MIHNKVYTSVQNNDTWNPLLSSACEPVPHAQALTLVINSLSFARFCSTVANMQVGLTPDQKKMWDREAGKKFKGMSLDDKNPAYIILWNEGRCTRRKISVCSPERVRRVCNKPAEPYTERPSFS